MPRRPDRYLEERRRDILRAARDAFVKDGYAGTTVSKIAQEAEMAAGTLYRYFDSKEDLIWAVAHEHIEEELTRFSVAGDESYSAGDQLLSVLEDVGKSRSAENVDDTVVSMESILASLRNPKLQKKVAGDVSDSILALAELIQRAQAQGDVDPQFNPHAVSALIHASSSGLANLKALMPDSSEEVESAEELMAALLESLYSPSLARRSREKKSFGTNANNDA